MVQNTGGQNFFMSITKWTRRFRVAEKDGQRHFGEKRMKGQVLLAKKKKRLGLF